MSGVQYKITDLANIGHALAWAQDMIERAIVAGPVVIEMKRETRSSEQNRLLWPLLTDISKQVEWFGRKHTPESWKDIITGSWRNCEFVPNIEGNGLVAVGLSTSRLNKADFSSLIEYIFCFGADKGVKWSASSEQVYQEHGPQQGQAA